MRRDVKRRGRGFWCFEKLYRCALSGWDCLAHRLADEAVTKLYFRLSELAAASYDGQISLVWHLTIRGTRWYAKLQMGMTMMVMSFGS